MNLLLVLIVFYILRSDKSASQAEIVLNHPLFPFRINSVGNGCFLKEVGFIPTGKVAIIYGHIQARCLDDGTIGYTDCCSNRNLAYCCPNGQKHIHYHFESTPTNFYNAHPISDIMHQDIPLSEVIYPAPFPFSADASGNFLDTSVIPSQDFAFPYTIPSTFHYLPGTPTEAVPPGLDLPYNAIQTIPPQLNDPSLQIIGSEIMSPQLTNNLIPTQESTVYDSLDHPYPAYFHDHFLQPEISLNDYFPDFNVLHNDFHDYDHLGTPSYQSVPSYIYHNNLFHNDFIYHDPTYFYNQLSQPEFISTADVPDIDVLHNHLLDYDHLGTPSSETISHHIYHNSLFPHDFIHQDQLLHDHDFADIPHHTIHSYHFNNFHFYHPEDIPLADTFRFNHYLHDLYHNEHMDSPIYHSHSHQFVHGNILHHNLIDRGQGPSIYNKPKYEFSYHSITHDEDPYYHKAIHSHRYSHHINNDYDHPDYSNLYQDYRVSTNDPHVDYHYYDHHHHHHYYHHHYDHYDHHHHNHYYDEPEPHYDHYHHHHNHYYDEPEPHYDHYHHHHNHYYDEPEPHYDHYHHHHNHYYDEPEPHYDHYHHHRNHYYDEPEPHYDHYHHHRHHYYDEPEHYHDDYHHHRHHYYDEPEHYHDDHYYHDYPPDDYYYPPYDHYHPYDDYYPEDDYPASYDDYHFHDSSHDPVFYDDNAFPYDDYHDPTCCGSLDYNYPYFDHPIHDYSFGDTGYHVLPLHDDYPSGYVYQHPYQGYPYHGEWYYDFPYDDYAGTQYPFRDYPFYGFPFYGFPYSHFPYEHPFHYPFHFPFHGFGYPGLVRSTHHSLVFDKVSPNDVNVEMNTKVQKAKG